MNEGKAELVLNAVAEGATLRRACREAGCDPRSFYDWTEVSPQRSQRYARARELQVKHWIDEIIDIADDNTRDVYENDKGRTIQDHDVVARAKLRVDTRRWLASKLVRDIYGDKETSDELKALEDKLRALEAMLEKIDKGKGPARPWKDTANTADRPI